MLNKIILSILFAFIALPANADSGTICGDITTRGFKISLNGRMVMQGFDSMGVSSVEIMKCTSMGEKFIGMSVVNPILCQSPNASVQISLTTAFGTVTGQVYSASGIPVFQGFCLPYTQ